MLNSTPMQPADDQPPPFLSRWRNVYALVILVLALDIVMLYFFTLRFR